MTLSDTEKLLARLKNSATAIRAAASQAGKADALPDVRPLPVAHLPSVPPVQVVAIAAAPAVVAPKTSTIAASTPPPTVPVFAPAPEVMEAAEVTDTPWEGIDDALRESVVADMQDLFESITAAVSSLSSGNITQAVMEELHRHTHTLKGVAGMAGAMRARRLLHDMEETLRDADASDRMNQETLAGLPGQVEQVGTLLMPFMAPQALSQASAMSPSTPSQASSVERQPPPILPAVRVPADRVDGMIAGANEARLVLAGLDDGTRVWRGLLRTMNANGQRLARLARDMEMDAETQIESHRAMADHAAQEFDPLELDRYTRWQEMSRSLTEAANDILEVQREMWRLSQEQEAALAYQERSLREVQAALHKSRLTPVEGLYDRLYGVAWKAAHELGKSVDFSLSAGGVELDRVFLEKISAPLEHLIRNSLAHGIESPQARLLAGKPAQGTIVLTVRQEAGRVWIAVEDDGAGLNTQRIRDKAVERGLWPSADPMNDEQAVDMICRPGFSTADAVSEIAGRGVGMDAVRASVLAMGGRMDIRSIQGKGLTATIQAPTQVATVAVLLVSAGEESWAIPVEMVEQVVRVPAQALPSAQARGVLPPECLQDQETVPDTSSPVPLAHLEVIMTGQRPPPVPDRAGTFLVLREGMRRLAVEVRSVSQVVDLPLRSVGTVWSAVPWVIGCVILPDGNVAFLVDPLRASNDMSYAPTRAIASTPARAVILTVDDSIAARKALEHCLSTAGYTVAAAKDGREALEVIPSLRPSLVLLDVDMPRMDGFECLRLIRENDAVTGLHTPVVMLTSRAAAKHRQHAAALGADDMLGKPFKEDVLLAAVRKHVVQSETPGSR